MRRSDFRRLAGRLAVFFWVLGGGLFWGGPGPEAKTIAFPEMAGWKPDKPQAFNPETLYEYINGAADLYLSYEFQDLAVLEYRGEKKAAVTVEVYRHKDPLQAFGIYSQERLADARFLDIGAQGYYEPNVLNFLTGPYYVKISGYNTGADDEETLLAFARGVEGALGGRTALPGIFSSFPREGKKANTEKFIAKNFLGYSYLHSGYTADYQEGGKKFKIFVIEGRDAKDCREMLEKYLRQAGNPEKKASEGTHLLKDPYHGEVALVFQGNRIWGVLGAEDPGLRSRALKWIQDAGR